MKLTEARCAIYRFAGNAAMIAAIPFWAIDISASWLAKHISKACTLAVVPNAIFYDWCVKRHNAIRALSEKADG